MESGFYMRGKADDGSRTHVSSLEGWGNSRYTTSAIMAYIIVKKQKKGNCKNNNIYKSL